MDNEEEVKSMYGFITNYLKEILTIEEILMSSILRVRANFYSNLFDSACWNFFPFLVVTIINVIFPKQKTTIDVIIGKVITMII